MLTKLISRPIVLRNAAVVSRFYHDPNHRPSTMDDLPVPQGDWQEDYAKKQSKHNAVLITGIVMLASAIGLAKTTGLIHLNYSPPNSID